MTDWLEIAIRTKSPELEEVAALISSEVPAAHSGTELREHEIVFWVLMEHAEQVLEETKRAISVLASRGIDVSPDEVVAQPALPEDEWRDAWKRYFHITRLTRQIVVVPSWENIDDWSERSDHDLLINLDPGQAFGTGAHASTRLVLEAMQVAKDDGFVPKSLVDVGTGSGILAIAAIKMWPTARGVAVDTDPIAVSTAAENAAKNAVGNQIDNTMTLVGSLSRAFDLVLANIRAPILTELSNDITARVAPGGRLFLSGLLTTEADTVAKVYAERHGLIVDHIRLSRFDDEWSGAELHRPAETA